MDIERSSVQPAVSPVFVVGVPRSGTTWIMRMLAAHPEAWPLIETYLFSPYRGLGALLRTVPAEQGEPPAEDRDWVPAGLGRLFSREELVAELRLLAERWLALAAGSEARFLVEKSPGHLAVVEMIAEVLPRARFVHVVRDGRDVAVSLVAARRSWSRFRETVPRRTVREAAASWSVGMHEGRDARDAVGDRLLEVRYEEVHADPPAAVARLFAHCGMPFDEKLVAAVVARTDINRSEDPRGEHLPLRGGRVGDWRERFGLLDALAFERRAGAALRESAYEPDGGWWRRRPLRSRL